MKKIVCLLIIIGVLFCFNVLAYSENFKFMVDTMGIELESRNGFPLNEEIYEEYNQFVYGSPLDITSGQRWKDVSDGNWTKNGGAWSGSGIRGEYWVLGFDVSGDEVHNHKFPADVEPSTPPTSWRYVVLKDAEDSWNNEKKFLHEEQRDYMLSSNLYRNGIEYELTARDIGLTKARVENYATWMTNGNIYTRRYDMNNKQWAANFIVPPMAGNAKFVSKLDLPAGYNYDLTENDIVDISIDFGAYIYNLSDYARKEHVKLVESDLYIDNSLVASVSNEKVLDVNSNYTLKVKKDNYAGLDFTDIKITVKSKLLTEFTADGVLTDVQTKVIRIIFGDNIDEVEENIPNNDSDKKDDDKVENNIFSPKISNFKVSRVSNSKFIELPIAKKTNSRFICAGQVMAIEFEVRAFKIDDVLLSFLGDKSIRTFDSLTQKFEWDIPRSRGVKTRYALLSYFQALYKNVIPLRPFSYEGNGNVYYRFIYTIPYGTKQSLHSWSTLREISNDAFSIDENKLFSRISKGYSIELLVSSGDYEIIKTFDFDVFERWDTLYNRNLTPYIK